MIKNLAKRISIGYRFPSDRLQDGVGFSTPFSPISITIEDNKIWGEEKPMLKRHQIIQIVLLVFLFTSTVAAGGFVTIERV